MKIQQSNENEINGELKHPKIKVHGLLHSNLTKVIKILPDIDWVKIPASEFIYGEGSEQQTLELDTFFISRYLITHAQFQCFIDDQGYQDQRWWQDIKKLKPESSRWTQANRPKDTVSWYEAIAFTRWLSAQFGFELTLPTEQQWEKATRGEKSTRYPW